MDGGKANVNPMLNVVFFSENQIKSFQPFFILREIEMRIFLGLCPDLMTARKMQYLNNKNKVSAKYNYVRT